VAKIGIVTERKQFVRKNLVPKRNIKNIFIILQRDTNIMANQVKKPIQNYFEKVLHENLTWEIPPLCFFSAVSRGIKIIRNKSLWSEANY
jgi:hypothetical protein